MHEPIAIIGIGCRFPGGVTSPETFWELLINEVDAITEIPANRFDLNTYYDATPATPGKVMSRWGGYLDKIDEFDAGFFGISPREVERMDPQQRLLLEVAWEALEDAGQLPDTAATQQTGIFVGQWLSDFEARLFRDPADADFYMTTGSGRYSSSGRLSYMLGFQGPSLTIDTACSSSLVAVHLATQSLRNGECRMALAGAANVILQPHITIAYSQSKMMAPDGHCKFGDELADGYVRSEGAAMIALKRLSDAIADGDSIYAVIRGSAVNNDGKTSGFMTTPGSAGQEEMLRKAYADAGVSPGIVQYVEAHGTGTNAGDPVEIGALGAVLAEDRPAGQLCMIGSVKTNLGHTEGAAGMAGLIKVVLSLKHKTLPASLHFHNPSPKIPWDTLPVRVQGKVTPWPEHEGAAIGGVSAFGIAGTNAHIVVEEADADLSPSGRGEQAGEKQGEHTGSPLRESAVVLPISAQTDEALKELAKRYQGLGAEADLRDVAYTAGVRRGHYARRLALVARTGEELAGHLTMFLNGETQRGMVVSGEKIYSPRKTVFVFPGQGGQWVGMGRQLLAQEPVFRDVMEQCQEAMRSLVDWSLIDELQSGARLDEIDVVQPMLFAVQVALAAVWRSWGIEPDAVIGHSMGEVAGACVAGVLSLEDAAQVICRRSQLMKRVSGKGAMAVVELTFDEALQAIAGYENQLGIAVSNGPRSTVISGDPAALDKVVEGLKAKDIFCRPVKVDVAAHSPHMDALRPELVNDLGSLQALETATPVYSTVIGALQDSTAFDAEYWGANLRQPVLFAAAVQQALSDGYNTFIEISPHPVLLAAVEQSIKAERLEDGLTLPSTRREEDERGVMLESLGKLYAAGHTIDWSQLYPDGRVLHLPTYPWQRERFWVEEAELDAGARQTMRRAGAHPMLGQYFKSQSGTHFWETRLDLKAFPYLHDHQVQGRVILPAAAYVEMALAAAQEVFGAGAHTLERVNLQEAMFISEENAPIVQIILTPEMPGRASYHCFSHPADDDQTWTLHASGQVRVGETAVHPEFDTPATLQGRMSETLSGDEHYRAMEARRLNYGTAFRGAAALWKHEGEALAEIQATTALAGYQLHPALLDAAFQILLETLGADGASDTYVPIVLNNLHFYGRPDAEGGLWAYARRTPPPSSSPDMEPGDLPPDAEAIQLREDSSPLKGLGGGTKDNHPITTGKGNSGGILEGDVLLLDGAGHVLMAAEGLRMQRLERGTDDQNDWLYEVGWVETTATPEPKRPEQVGSWLILADQGGIGTELAARLHALGEQAVMVSAGDQFAALDADHYQVNPMDFQPLLREITGGQYAPLRGVIHLWTADEEKAGEHAGSPLHQNYSLDGLHKAEMLGAISALHLTQALGGAGISARGWMVDALTLIGQRDTFGTRSVDIPLPNHPSPSSHGDTLQGRGEEDRTPYMVSLQSSALWGFWAVLANEHPELRPTRVSIDGIGSGEALFRELWVEDEDQVRLESGKRFAARLGSYQAADTQTVYEQRLVNPDEIPFKIEVTTPGMLDGLKARATTRPQPQAGQVEIEVHATGLYFMNVLAAQGAAPGNEGAGSLGIECAGRISNVGEGVTDWQVGDEVVAIAFDSLATHAVTDARLVAYKPANLSFEEAASIPIVFLTAHYGLNRLGGLESGERVLIHTATGGVGLAAIQLARLVGAEIWATAGTAEKREYLREMGVEHILDSRSLAFADTIMAETDGVDVILNSLTGDAVPRGLAILRPYGRFLEISKRNIYQNTQMGLLPFQKNLSYFGIDLDRMARERPAFIGAMLREIMGWVESGELQPIPVTSFAISQAAEAFRYMAQAKHIGKVVISVREENVPVEIPQQALIRNDGSYLISGGLGGLGLEVAKWLATQGAGQIVLMGRSAPSEAAQAVIHEIEAAGTLVEVAQVDVGQAAAVAALVEQIRENMLPLRGIFHAAGVLEDSTIAQMDADRFRRAMIPKMDGAWNLHTATQDSPLDCFVMFSSVTALLGTPGQANYAAGNAFVDALANYRRSQGQAAISINWGPWSEVGLAAAQTNRGERLASRGLGSITPEQGMATFDRLMKEDVAQVGVMSFEAAQWAQTYRAAQHSSLLMGLLEDRSSAEAAMTAQSAEQQDDIKTRLLATEAGRARRTLLENYIKEQVARVLGLAASRIDGQKPLRNMGIDSLMTVELRNRLETTLKISLPATVVFNYPTVTALTGHLAEKMGVPLEAEKVSAEAAPSAENSDNLENLSRDEVEAMLADELNSLDELLRGS